MCISIFPPGSVFDGTHSQTLNKMSLEHHFEQAKAVHIYIYIYIYIFIYIRTYVCTHIHTWTCACASACTHPPHDCHACHASCRHRNFASSSRKKPTYLGQIAKHNAKVQKNKQANISMYMCGLFPHCSKAFCGAGSTPFR